MTITVSFWTLYWIIVVLVGAWGFAKVGTSEGFDGMDGVLAMIIAITMLCSGLLCKLFG